MACVVCYYIQLNVFSVLLDVCVTVWVGATLPWEGYAVAGLSLCWCGCQELCCGVLGTAWVSVLVPVQRVCMHAWSVSLCVVGCLIYICSALYLRCSQRKMNSHTWAHTFVLKLQLHFQRRLTSIIRKCTWYIQPISPIHPHYFRCVNHS